ncbi:MAG TPA: YcxB family protein [Candidatus Intestinimonas stercorigallinarum]|nr:YcxB family protein [Candidatus Intestinimonas stercorigallinarum]
MELKAKTRYDRRDLEAFQRGADRIFRWRRVRRTRTLFLVTGIIALAAATFADMSGLMRTVGGAVGAILLVRALLSYPMDAWTASRRLPKGDHSVSFTFKEEEMTVGNDQASVKHAYSDLLVAGETGTYFFLFLSSQLGYIVDKRSMAAGEADILRERLEAALGEPVQAL